MAENKKIHFNRNSHPDFYPELRKRVDEYFNKNNISIHANTAMVIKTISIVSLFAASYFLILFSNWSDLTLLFLACSLGFLSALIGFNIAHDAVHGAYSSNTIINKYLGMFFNLLGTNDYVWKIKHNIIHHTFTNIPDHDGDINQNFMIRMKPTQKKLLIHRLQHLYVFLLYPFASLTWVLFNDYENFFKKKLGWYDNSKHPRKELFRLFFYKALYFSIFLLVPLLVLDLPWYKIVAGFIALHMIEGLTLAVVFQLAHVVEDAEFPIPSENGELENSWAVHQMYTTANFARSSSLANFLFGGLNFQIEHHLFPKICHIHYKNISPIVQQTAKEFGLPYIENKTFAGAILSHVRTMKVLGRN